MPFQHITPPKHLCHPKTRLVCESVDEKHRHILVGIGLISGKKGLSVGLPIDAATMILSADLIRRDAYRVDASEKIKIYIHLADGLAKGSLPYLAGIQPEEIEQRKESTAQVIHAFCEQLGIDDIVIEDTSKIESTATYQGILSDLKGKAFPTRDGGQTLDDSAKNYVLLQTALVATYAKEKRCGLKVSWYYHRDHIENQDLEHVFWHGIDKGLLDEAWFDATTLLLLDNCPLQFVFTLPGSEHSSNSTHPPYYVSRYNADRRVLFGETPDAIQRKLSTGGRYHLSSTGRNLYTAILRVLKQDYADRVKIASVLNFSDLRQLVNDITVVSQLVSQPTKIIKRSPSPLEVLSVFSHRSESGSAVKEEPTLPLGQGDRLPAASTA